MSAVLADIQHIISTVFFAIDLSLFKANWLSILGLSLDILGAFFLAKSFITKQLSEIQKETMSMIGTNYHATLSLCKQKQEAQWGFGLLLTGFIFQIASYISNLPVLGILVIIFMLIFLLGYWIRQRVEIIHVENFHKIFDYTQTENLIFNYDWNQLKDLGKRVGIEKLPNENFEDFKARVLSKRRELYTLHENSLIAKFMKRLGFN